MSGLIPDLASWALRGQRNNNEQQQDGETTSGANSQQQQQQGVVMTAEELRAQRVQRMELLQQRQRQEQAAAQAASGGNGDGLEPMQVDTDNTITTPTTATTSTACPKKSPPSAAAAVNDKKAPPTVITSAAAAPANPEKKRKAEKANDPAKRLARKKELLIRKVLNIIVVTPDNNTAAMALPDSSSALVTMELDDSGEISVQTVAELITNRVSGTEPVVTLSSSPSLLLGSPTAGGSGNKSSLLAYLADCHRKAAEELKSIRSKSSSIGGGGATDVGGGTVVKNKDKAAAAAELEQHNAELTLLLQEVQSQAVNYGATILMEPTLFHLGKDSVTQLSNCLLTALSDLTSSITFGVGGNSASSFYHCLVEELVAQDPGSLKRVLQEILQSYQDALAKCDSILDNSAIPTLGGGAVSDNNPITIISALTALTMHKKVAELITQTPGFLLPPPNTPEADQIIRPPPPATAATNPLLQQFMASLQQSPSYKKRSGPGLEKSTLLGLCLRLGIPVRNNPGFSSNNILRQSLASVESATSQQRQQLRLYQEACNQFLGGLIKAGVAARSSVLQWFVDALLVNVGAAASRPDPTKVSSPHLLLNLSCALLKLCEPFVDNPTKHHLIDPNFCAAADAHQGIYALTGDNAVPRLGSTGNPNMMNVEYKPQNGFVTQLFFLTERAIHFGMGSSLMQHEGLLRRLNHLHWMITSRGGDLQSDPHFAMAVSMQRAAEVALFEEDLVASHVKFLQLVAKFLTNMPDDTLGTMPEDFVSDVCHVISSFAKFKPKVLRGVNAGPTFVMVVKMLSPTYAMMVRNYNLRAMLGDVLYEMFLPPTNSSHRHDTVPSSVYVDAVKGETFLLSDPGAQQTLAPSLLLLYGEVEHTGYYDRMSHRAKISSLIQYLWESKEHRPAFRLIAQNKKSFIKFANGIMNETNLLIATVMQKLPEIREAQAQMKNGEEWSRLTEEQQTQISERLEENEREVKHALPLCNKTLQMFGYLNTDEDIRNLFMLEELCSRLVSMLLHVLTKLVGSKGLELKVDNPEELDFKPKVMLRDLCYIFSLFADKPIFQEECAKSGGDSNLLRQALKTVRRLNLLQGDQLEAFVALPDLMDKAAYRVAQDEALLADAPDEFLDELMSTYMKDPVKLPSGHFVDRSTITQHLLNDPSDPFNRQPLKIEDVEAATELKARMDAWLEEKRASAMTDA